MQLILAALTCTTIVLAPFFARAEELVILPTRPGVTVRFLFEAPEAAQAAVVLFAGNAGALHLTLVNDVPKVAGLAGNFLVRSRHDFARAGFAVATLDAPSDSADGMTTAFRVGRQHAIDVAAVASWMKAKVQVPVWLIGTSQGTVSAASAAIYLGRNIDGLILTSSVIREGGRSGSAAPEGVLSLDLARIAVPVLTLAHAGDSCQASPPEGARTIERRLSRAPRHTSGLIRGGRPAQSGPCEAFAPHGYYGVEGEAIARIGAFIRGE
jgi:hypothetical protein